MLHNFFVNDEMHMNKCLTTWHFQLLSMSFWQLLGYYNSQIRYFVWYNSWESQNDVYSDSLMSPLSFKYLILSRLPRIRKSQLMWVEFKSRHFYRLKVLIFLNCLLIFAFFCALLELTMWPPNSWLSSGNRLFYYSERLRQRSREEIECLERHRMCLLTDISSSCRCWRNVSVTDI